MLKALEKLKDLPFRYYICGEGPYRQALEEQTARLGLEEKVIFLGFRKDLDFLLQGADIFLFPSVREGLGMAALEAMACGVPVLGADNRGTREYIRHGENGLLCPPRNAEDFATAIHILYENPILRRKMAVRARKDSWRFGKEESRLYMEQVYKIAWKGEEEMTSGPKISVIMSLYNPRPFHWLKAAVDSILDQSFNDLNFSSTTMDLTRMPAVYRRDRPTGSQDPYPPGGRKPGDRLWPECVYPGSKGSVSGPYGRGRHFPSSSPGGTEGFSGR